MTAPDLETKSLAPEWLRAANATLTAWTSFITTLAVFLVVIWLFPSSHGLAGTPALLLLVLMLSAGVLIAAVATRWQIRRMKLSSMRPHLWLFLALVVVACLTLPSPFVFMILK
ncbi:MAG: hypothetical protein ACK5GN_15275 [Pseudomonadota bacterium]|jgi:hypothetical protein